METVIAVRNIRKVYRMGEERIVALDDISLDFCKGRIYCLFGPSGSGKSTLLNMLAGLEKPTNGSVRFNGVRLESLNEKQLARFRQRYVGFVFQSYNLLPALSALENVQLPLIFRRIGKRVRTKKAREMLAAVGLAHRVKHKPAQMSGGQQQRVSIARAFVNNPQVVFCDEPTGNLDTKITFEMMDLITGIARDKEQTLIIVSHDEEVAAYADQIVFIRDGNVEKIINPKEKNGKEKNNDEQTALVADGPAGA